MNNNFKDQLGHDVVCRSHSARSERDIYRVCPSKLNKKELEDLYYALLENNLELKRTINGQREKIKMLTTKVQRMSSVQKSSFSRESRECCLTTKAVVNEQKEIIAELKKSNERMSERIRLLNMRVCSAKQFVKRSPTQSTIHCVKCSTQPAKSKNSSTIALNMNISETNMKNAAVSCHDLIEKSMPSTRSVQTETNEGHEKEDSEKQCNENKCRTLMEELKQKIVNLQEELSTTHSEYSSRIGRLEMEVSSLQARDHDTKGIASRLTRAEVRNGELAMELSIERGKVAELETSVKAAQMSSKVAATIEGHLANINQARRESYPRSLPVSSPNCPVEWEERTPRLQIQQSTPTKAVCSVDFKLDSSDIKHTKNSDDSGYTEANKSTEVSDSLNKVNQELMKKIVELQTKLDHLQVSATSEMVINGKATETSINIEDTVVDKSDEKMFMDVENHDCVIIEPDRDVIVEPKINNIKTNDLNKEQLTKNVSPAVDKISSAGVSTAKYPLVWMNEGQKNQEDTDDGSYTIKPGDKPPPSETKPEVEPKYEHNRYQIPGPITSDTGKSNKNTRRRSFSIGKNKAKEDRKSKDDVTPVNENDAELICSIKKSYEDDKIVNLNNRNVHDDNAAVKFDNGKLKKDFLEISQQRLGMKALKPLEESIPAIRKKKIDEDKQEHSNYYIDPATSNHLLNIEQHAMVPERKDTQLGTHVDYQAAVEPCPPHKCSIDAAATYSVEERRHDSRGSDKDTDHEISAMSDLPTERDDKGPARILSPGEKALSTSIGTGTSTGTRTYSAPTDAGTLSEGELPTVGRARKLSIGERPMNDVMPGARRRSSPQKMEEALHAVTEELARCKQLLNQRQQQVNYVPTFT